MTAHTSAHHRVGRVTHYYPKVGVVIVALDEHIAVGDTLHFQGKKTDLIEQVSSIQIEHKDVQEANKGELVGIKVSGKLYEGDDVHKEEQPNG